MEFIVLKQTVLLYRAQPHILSWTDYEIMGLWAQTCNWPATPPKEEQHPQTERERVDILEEFVSFYSHFTYLCGHFVSFCGKGFDICGFKYLYQKNFPYIYDEILQYVSTWSFTAHKNCLLPWFDFVLFVLNLKGWTWLLPLHVAIHQPLAEFV